MAPVDRHISAPEIAPYEPTDSEEYMNPAQKEHFRKILREWQRQLQESVTQTVSHMKDDSGSYPDPTDRATQEEGFALELRTRDRERKLLRKIQDTLTLIDNDEYGYCESCGVDIGLRRLEARPTATLCIDCKTVQELQEKRQAR